MKRLLITHKRKLVLLLGILVGVFLLMKLNSVPTLVDVITINR